MKHLMREMTASAPPFQKDPVSLLTLKNFFCSLCHNSGLPLSFHRLFLTPVWWEPVFVALKTKITHSLASESEGLVKTSAIKSLVNCQLHKMFLLLLLHSLLKLFSLFVLGSVCGQTSWRVLPFYIVTGLVEEGGAP